MEDQKNTRHPPKPKTPKRIGSTIKKEAIRASDFLRYELPFACEDCSHFCHSDESCTFGLQTEHHLKRNQLASYHLSGKIALCRFQEID